ncbi:class I SAM-dependent methyltransferase [Nocardioides zeae]|uniref:Class I SAM-dependent methyltransferase n=1 Tax=Nocardioides imazamoxiresistens TaxID=3231893 RepID=A0ABU3PX40_9ACTN|nr:class I SAM-dependent methyltransferase [Nocardioides zeae]MDT9593798.1 class I SAM-dependent methyltransferase [Nocardioides zeae]
MIRIKRLYVVLARAVRTVLGAIGVIGLLDRWAARSRTGLWVRSWFSVYDLDALVAHDVPWWTFDAADAVADFLAARPGARALEWGSGASTVWLAARCGEVVSIEHDAAWATSMARVLPDNASLRVVPPVDLRTRLSRDVVPSSKRGFEGLDFADYVAEVDHVPGDFDVVVVDGRAREACLRRAVERLRPGGMVVVDNVERARYRAAIDEVCGRHDVTVTWTRGRTPTLPYPTATALLERAPVVHAA